MTRTFEYGFADYGISKVDPARQDVDWAMDDTIYTDSRAYYLDYREIGALRNQMGYAPVRTYLGFGTGLGRQVVLFSRANPTLQSVVAVDRETPIHTGVHALGLRIEEMRTDIVKAIDQLAAAGISAFDLICFENTGPVDISEIEKRRGKLHQLLNDNGMLLFVGEAPYPYRSFDQDDRFIHRRGRFNCVNTDTVWIKKT